MGMIVKQGVLKEGMALLLNAMMSLNIRFAAPLSCHKISLDQVVLKNISEASIFRTDG
jgi:hypothetical protein